MTINNATAHRLFLLQALGERCRNCNTKKKLHLDHKKPIFAGGKDHFRNLQLLCKRCHYEKSGKDLEIFHKSKKYHGGNFLEVGEATELIAVSRNTKEFLKNIRIPGETYNEIIIRLSRRKKLKVEKNRRYYYFKRKKVKAK